MHVIPMLSVIIPAYNEESVMGKCLESLVYQIVSEPFEVIVVDNNSTDRTAEIARSFTDRLDIKVLSEKRQLRGAARATGCASAKGDILCCTDADSILPPHWLQTYATTLRPDDRIVAATALGKLFDCPARVVWTYRLLFGGYMRLYAIIRQTALLTGYNFAIKKSAYDAVGGFNAKSDAGEDLELTYKVRTLGKILFVPEATIQTSGRRFRRGFFRGWLEYMKTYVQKFLLRRKTVSLSNIK